MQMFRFFSCFSFVYTLILLSIQAVDINISSHPVHNGTNDIAASRQLFKEFVKKYNRTYLNNPEEFGRRFIIFQESLVRHANLNAREKELNGTAVYGVNQFSDWTVQEFKEFLRRGSKRGHGVLTNSVDPDICQLIFCDLQLNGSVTPLSQDWGKKKMLTAVKNQGKCGSCWAFTATECVESQWAIAGNTLTELSVQELISCVRKNGCSGGNTLEALFWLQKERNTLVRASEFPYVDKETTCKTNVLKEQGVKIKCGCPLIMENKTEQVDMKQMVGLHGPLAVNVDATMWHDYLSGIIQHHCTDTDINHAVQITGYNFNGHIWYWIVRNSWGSSFGENGYLYIKMGDNLCGVADSPSYVVI